MSVNRVVRVLVPLVAGAAALVAVARGGRAFGSAHPELLPKTAADYTTASSNGQGVAVFAGGCFWGMQLVFQHVKGVNKVVSGYSGGHMVNPTYGDVSTGETGHAESIEITYDTSKVSYGTLLRVFFSVHDPTTLNRQGPDVGTEYRSAVFYTNDEQKKTADAYIAQLTQAKKFSRPIVTEVAPFRAFYPAEAYHQNYATLHPEQPYIAINDLPKLEFLKTRMSDLYQP